MEQLVVTRINGEWHGWSDVLSEWLPLPLTADVDENHMRDFYSARNKTVSVVADSKYSPPSDTQLLLRVKEYVETTDDDGIRTRQNILRILSQI